VTVERAEGRGKMEKVVESHEIWRAKESANPAIIVCMINF